MDSLSFHKLLSLTSVVIFCFAFAFSFATCIQSKCPVFCLSQSMPSRFLQEDYWFLRFLMPQLRFVSYCTLSIDAMQMI